MWDVEHDGDVAVAVWDNPPHGFYDLDGFSTLSALTDQWAADPSVRAVVLTGRNPGRFVTMFSPDALAAGQRAPLADRVAAGPDRYLRMHESFTRLTKLQKPVIAALNGDAMGIGFILALSCDIRIAQRGDHRYGLPEVKLGLVPGASGLQRLARLIGPAQALNLALRGRVVDPENALALGLVHELADDARAAATELARALATLPAQAVGLTKYAFHAGMDLRLDDAVALEADACQRAKLSNDALVAIEKFTSQSFDDARRWITKEPTA